MNAFSVSLVISVCTLLAVSSRDQFTRVLQDISPNVSASNDTAVAITIPATTTVTDDYQIQDLPTVKGTPAEDYDYTPPSESDEDAIEEAPVVKKQAKKKVFAPELLLLDPKPRTYSNTSTVNDQPCGGAEKGKAHYLTYPGSKNYLQFLCLLIIIITDAIEIEWKVSHPTPEGNCTVRVGHGLDEDESNEGRLIVLHPKDGSANDDGSFACGREIGYEGKIFTFPRNFTCDSCTLQFEWTIAGGGQIHQCADFIMAAGEAEECSGKCQNGGVCSNGECMCRSSYSGNYCQYKGMKL